MERGELNGAETNLKKPWKEGEKEEEEEEEHALRLDVRISRTHYIVFLTFSNSK